MSAYYGTLQSDKGESTRAGHRFIRASAQSWDGSVTVEIANGQVQIGVAQGSGVGGRAVWIGPLSEMLDPRFRFRRCMGGSQ